MNSGEEERTKALRGRTKQERVIVVYQGASYDVTEFLDKHPGGRDVILGYADRSVTKVMCDSSIHRHSAAAYSILQAHKVISQSNEKNLPKSQRSNVDDLTGWKEELVDWNKPMLAQVHKLGPEYMNWVHSPVDFNLRLFESQFVEFFSKTPWYIIPIVWIPVVMYFSLLSAVKLHSAVSVSDYWLVNRIGALPLAAFLFSAWFAFGILVWSFLEYILHRYLFHLTPPPNSPFWITLHFFLHGQHHKVPFDGDRLVFPPAAAAVFAVLFYVLLTTTLPVCLGQALFAGGLLGYVIYDLTHYYLHHGSPLKNSYLDKLKQYHVAHHFINQSKGFGISSKLWDFPFGTLP